MMVEIWFLNALPLISASSVKVRMLVTGEASFQSGHARFSAIPATTLISAAPFEDIVNTAGTGQHVDTRHRTDRHGQHIALVLVQQVHVDEPDRHGNARHASGLYPGLRLIELVELLGEQFHVLVVEGLAVVVEQFGSRGELDRNVLPDGLGDTGRDFALIGGIRSLISISSVKFVAEMKSLLS